MWKFLSPSFCFETLDFSNKYVLMFPPTIFVLFVGSNIIWMYFPKREELSFLVVFALPMASMIGLEARTRFSIVLLNIVEDVVEVVIPDLFMIEEDIIWEAVMLLLSLLPAASLTLAMLAKYLMANLAETVFPAPDSPDTINDWFLDSLSSLLYASSATA